MQRAWFIATYNVGNDLTHMASWYNTFQIMWLSVAFVVSCF